MATTREIVGALKRSRALTGESLDPGAAEGIVRAGLREESDRALRSRGIALQERAFKQGVKERKEDRRTQNLAGTIGAGVKVGGLFVENKLQNRALDIAATRAATEKSLLGGLFPSGAASVATDTAAGIAEGNAVAAALGPGTEAATGVVEAGGGFGTGLKTGVAGAAGAFVGSQFGKGKGKQVATGIGSALGTALISSNPYTIAISGIISALGSGDDKVICAEMNRHGYISDNVLALDCVYSIMYIDTPTHVGYRIFADKFVRVLRSNRLIRAIVAPFAVAWAHAMAEKVDSSVIVKYWHRYLGNFLMKTITPVCRFIGRRLLNG